MAKGARGRAHGDRVGGVGARGRGGEVLIAVVRPKAGIGRRCARCRRRCPGYDTSPAARRWRAFDLGSTQVHLQATTQRVSCAEHGVVVAAVPWARPAGRGSPNLLVVTCHDTGRPALGPSAEERS
ncbi:transposase family protein [Pseudonocardia aurantiaca]|uniref:Transposase family protein n=1 Tax=Pseudonocardia aurantiaca TaxID=75290 RepID=A0ABW4FV91_9PSEU